MDASIRRATLADLPAMTDLLLRDARQRSALEPSVWRVADDARARVEAAVVASLDGSNARLRELWHVAEVAGKLVGVTHAMVVTPPPIYAVPEPPGLFLDDCCTAPDAPPGTAEALLVATETALRAAGAAGLVASCPMAGPWRGVYERHGYEPVTLYMAKSGFDARAVPTGVRPATRGRRAGHRQPERRPSTDAERAEPALLAYASRRQQSLRGVDAVQPDADGS